MRKKVYMIGNAHLDPVWLWRWQEGYAENRATLLSILDRLDEYDEVVVTSSSAQFYEWIEQSEPALFERICQRVREKRLVLCGGWWVQPDCNLPCGESFARHTLLAQNYFQDKFGKISTVGYCVDSFGHSGMLPQILRLSRMGRYVFMRPAAHEKDIPANLFLWESPDGTRIPTFRIPMSYTAPGDLSQRIDECAADHSGEFPGVMCFYGVGNHGGGPTIQNIESIRKKQEAAADLDIAFSSPEEYFMDVASSGCEPPIVRGDLQHHASGCYSAHSQIKRLNRLAENALLAAEKYSVMAGALAGAPFPGEALERAWKDVLFNQFHDILAGTSIERACEDAVHTYGEAISLAERAQNAALQAVSFRVPIPRIEGAVPLVLFNPLAWGVKGEFEFEWGTFANTQMPEDFCVYDADLRIIPHQVIDPEVQMRRRVRVSFVADVPATGYTRVTIAKGSPKAMPATDPNDLLLENAFLLVEISRQTGGIARLLDKKRGRGLLCADAAVGTVIQDASDTWGHNVFSFHDTAGCFAPLRVFRVESGPVRSRVRVESRYGHSILQQDFILYAHKDQLDVRVSVNWQERLKCLRLDFPLALADAKATYEVPFGSMEKAANGQEEPMQNWVDLSGTHLDGGYGAGLTVLNDGKYSAAALGNKLSLTVLRSPVFSHHVPMELGDPPVGYRFMDQGWQSFRYALVPHGGQWRAIHPVRRGMEVNQGPSLVPETFHAGDLSAKAGVLAVDAPNVVATCLKKARGSDSIILRLWETEGKPTAALLEVYGAPEPVFVELRPYEIRTLAISPQTREIITVDLLEWELSENR